MALGIFSVAISMILGLLPVGIQTVHKSIGEVEATQLLQRIEGDIRNVQLSGTASHLGGTASPQGAAAAPLASPLYKIPVASGSNTLYFGRDLGLIELNPAVVSGTSYYRVACVQSGTSPQLNFHLRVTWPAAANPANAEGSSEVATTVFLQ